jgi:hypothetical protein
MSAPHVLQSFTRVIATAIRGPAGHLPDTGPPNEPRPTGIPFGLLFDGGERRLAEYAPDRHDRAGSESDIDGNEVIFPLTDAVNALSGSCPGGSIILGFFYGGDLLPRSGSNPGSNEAEIFYGLVPKTGGSCSAPKDFVIQVIAPTFIHEFQHMISYNQHVLVGGSSLSEETWLNEGLSHSRRAGRLHATRSHGLGGATSSLAQFAIGDLLNERLFAGPSPIHGSPGTAPARSRSAAPSGSCAVGGRSLRERCQRTDVTRPGRNDADRRDNVSSVTGDPMTESCRCGRWPTIRQSAWLRRRDPRLQYGLELPPDLRYAECPAAGSLFHENTSLPDSTSQASTRGRDAARGRAGRPDHPATECDRGELARPPDGSAFPSDRAVRWIVRIR